MYPELIKGFLYVPRTYQEEGREGFQRATAKPFGRLRRGENLCRITKSDNTLSLSQTHQGGSLLTPNLSRGRPRRFPKGERKALWSPPQRRKPLPHTTESIYGQKNMSHCPPAVALYRVKATQACTFRLGEKYPKPTGAANLGMREWPPRTPVS